MENLQSWFDGNIMLQQFLILATLTFVVYVGWNILSLLWRIPELVMAKRDLAIARTHLAESHARYYNVLISEKEGVNKTS